MSVSGAWWRRSFSALGSQARTCTTLESGQAQTATIPAPSGTGDWRPETGSSLLLNPQGQAYLPIPKTAQPRVLQQSPVSAQPANSSDQSLGLEVHYYMDLQAPPDEGADSSWRGACRTDGQSAESREQCVEEDLTGRRAQGSCHGGKVLCCSLRRSCRDLPTLLYMFPRRTRR